MKIREFVKAHGGYISWKKTGEDKRYAYGVLNGYRVRVDKKTGKVEVLGEETQTQ